MFDAGEIIWCTDKLWKNLIQFLSLSLWDIVGVTGLQEDCDELVGMGNNKDCKNDQILENTSLMSNDLEKQKTC